MHFGSNYSTNGRLHLFLIRRHIILVDLVCVEQHKQWWMVKGLKLSGDEKCFCFDSIKCNYSIKCPFGDFFKVRV